MDEIEIASGAEAVAALGPLWDEIGERSGARSVFEQFDLVRAAAELAKQAGAEPIVLIFRAGGQTRAVLPLRIERRLGARTAVSLVHPLAQYTDVVGARLTAAPFGIAMQRLGEIGVDLLLLRKVRADSGLQAALDGHAQTQRASETALYIDLSAYGSFKSYNASFSGSTRRNRRQRRQKLEANAGPVTFEVLRGAAALPAFTTAVGWKQEWLRARGISSPVFDGGAWEGLLRETVLSGEAIVSVLSAGGSPAAIEVGFADRTTYIAYLGAFAPELGDVSPGQEQMLNTIAWCFDQGFERYDLLAPADDYKRHWARAETGVAIDDYAVALSPIGHGVAELRRRVRPLVRDLYFRLSPEVRVAGGRLGKPAAAAAAAAACAGAVLVAME